ncbi:MAG: hypothetical protein KGJ06_02600 [Pseudomonadota bacterium]|nr:hypothetical protein [Pseudomonadota bacterium]
MDPRQELSFLLSIGGRTGKSNLQLLDLSTVNVSDSGFRKSMEQMIFALKSLANTPLPDSDHYVLKDISQRNFPAALSIAMPGINKGLRAIDHAIAALDESNREEAAIAKQMRFFRAQLGNWLDKARYAENIQSL